MRKLNPLENVIYKKGSSDIRFQRKWILKRYLPEQKVATETNKLKAGSRPNTGSAFHSMIRWPFSHVATICILVPSTAFIKRKNKKEIKEQSYSILPYHPYWPYFVVFFQEVHLQIPQVAACHWWANSREKIFMV